MLFWEETDTIYKAVIDLFHTELHRLRCNRFFLAALLTSASSVQSKQSNYRLAEDSGICSRVGAGTASLSHNRHLEGLLALLTYTVKY